MKRRVLPLVEDGIYFLDIDSSVCAMYNCDETLGSQIDLCAGLLQDVSEMMDEDFGLPHVDDIPIPLIEWAVLSPVSFCWLVSYCYFLIVEREYRFQEILPLRKKIEAIPYPYDVVSFSQDPPLLIPERKIDESDSTVYAYRRYYSARYKSSVWTKRPRPAFMWQIPNTVERTTVPLKIVSLKNNINA